MLVQPLSEGRCVALFLRQVGSAVTGVQKGGRVIGLQGSGSGGFAEEIISNVSVSPGARFRGSCRLSRCASPAAR